MLRLALPIWKMGSMPPDSAVWGCRVGRILHSTPRDTVGCTELSHTTHSCCQRGEPRSQLLAEPPAASVSLPPGERITGMAALRVLPLQRGPWSNSVPTPLGARPTPGGTRGSAPDSSIASDGPRESGAHAPVPALRPSGVPQPQPQPQAAPRSAPPARQLAPGRPRLPVLQFCASCSGAP